MLCDKMEKKTVFFVLILNRELLQAQAHVFRARVRVVCFEIFFHMCVVWDYVVEMYLSVIVVSEGGLSHESL